MKKYTQPPPEERLEALRRLPKEVIERLTKKEIQIFLYEDEWPVDMAEKLKDYLEDI